ncbi:hypothetical protein Hypma_007695 [Hypsizygus marmoreus]|uniref:Uncharacterized protein n=1 Tax=Hypsizygus marmoreus TaxID=39966 RepID=A0A369JSJ0_HYPMA|nr:hypothetical protein Hypma_007695 [Hypsizygus marmoreus]
MTCPFGVLLAVGSVPERHSLLPFARNKLPAGNDYTEQGFPSNGESTQNANGRISIMTHGISGFHRSPKQGSWINSHQAYTIRTWTYL